MPSRRAASSASVVAFLQSMLAVIGWLFSITFFVGFGPKVDLSSPHQVPFLDLAFIFAPALWLTLTAILSLFQTKSGWWLSVLTDLLLAAIGTWSLFNNIVDVAIMRTRHVMVFEDGITLLVLFVLPLTTLILLFSRSMRAVGIGQRMGRNR